MSHALRVMMSYPLSPGYIRRVVSPPFAFLSSPITHTKLHFPNSNILLTMSLFTITPAYSVEAVKAIEEHVDATASKRVPHFFFVKVDLCFFFLVHLLLAENHINDLDRVVSEEIKDKSGKGSW